jgi:hypothetical protein
MTAKPSVRRMAPSGLLLNGWRMSPSEWGAQNSRAIVSARLPLPVRSRGRSVAVWWVMPLVGLMAVGVESCTCERSDKPEPAAPVRCVVTSVWSGSYGTPDRLVFNRAGLLFDDRGQIWDADRGPDVTFDVAIQRFRRHLTSGAGEDGGAPAAYKVVGMVDSHTFARMKALREPAARSTFSGGYPNGLPDWAVRKVLIHGVGDGGDRPVVLAMAGSAEGSRVGPEALQLRSLLRECAREVRGGDPGPL